MARESWPVASECEAGEIVGIESARTDTGSFSSIDGCLNSAFLGLFETSCTSSFSGHGYPMQGAAEHFLSSLGAFLAA